MRDVDAWHVSRPGPQDERPGGRYDVLVDDHGLKVKLLAEGVQDGDVHDARCHVGRAQPGQPFLDLLEKAYGHERDAVNWFIQTLAYRLQQTKLPRQELVVCLYSEAGATGKGAILQTLELVFGRAAAHITDFRSAFTDMNAGEHWLGNFILLDETSVTYRQMEVLKSTVSNQRVSSNAKGRGRTDYEINAVPVMATNERPYIDPAFSRRILLLDSRLDTLMPSLPDRAAYLTEYKNWLADGGAQLIHSWLMQRSVSGYSVHRDAPMTAVKSQTQKLVSSSPSQLFRDREDTDTILYRVGELQEVYGFAKKSEVLRHELDEAGISEVRVCKVGDNKLQLCAVKPWRFDIRSTGKARALALVDDSGHTVWLKDAQGYADIAARNTL